ncbi:MAG: CBS domain-containing protein, partial [Actinomycetota bacterium]
MVSWRDAIVAPTASVRDAIRSLGASGKQIALVLDRESHLLGVVTDGDIRRALLNGIPLDISVTKIMSAHARTASVGDSPTTMVQLMRVSG